MFVLNKDHVRQDIGEEAAAELEVGFFVEFFICFLNTFPTIFAN